MPAKLSMYLPDQAVAMRVLADGADLVFGRDPHCDLPLLHSSVSRRHARLAELAPGQWQLSDLGSKNGTRVGGACIDSITLERRCWFAVGDIYCEIELIDAAEEQVVKAREAGLRVVSSAWNQRVLGAANLQPLLADLLAGIVQVAECDRGFLLTPDSLGQLRVVACYGLVPDDLNSIGFLGSRSAVERVRMKRQPVYLSAHGDRAWLQDSASVVAQGIRALVCLPLISEGELLGIAYADTATEARVFTDLDAELLDALVGHATATLRATKLAAQLAKLSAWIAVDERGSTSFGALPVWGRPA